MSSGALHTTTVIKQCHTLLKYCRFFLLQTAEGSYRKAMVHYTITPVILEAPPLAYFDMMMKFLSLYRRKKINLKNFSLASLQQQNLECTQ